MDALDIPRLRGVSHAYAFFFALVAAVCLIVFTPGGAPRMAAAVYGAGLCAVFGGSGLYHRWRWNPRWRPILRRVDHSTIYLFIAASYTPVGMLVLSGTVQWIVLITVWSGALAGVTLSVAWINAPRAICALCYVALGWVAVVAFPQMHAELPGIALVLLGLGGLFYTVGAIIYALGRPNPWPAVFGFHEIFHVFVILAAITHFITMAGWIVPSGLDA
ncbi:hemolysin III family protein [Solirubrobacter sp. CPCC 204708]|uniref:Hemolysin III family protein n=1 Tax=Solirubrobacter deserti TaxID=2282478 RepID=A0ABT4RHF7_9ACTN|nr:hemolysin III family protein [Solirubrobacter deserti]MBE2315301.1 hemolysin III family protein [Solirubrobacter deserti]MDA0137986.1 hemolysin III family protein [Solirubrobacter deserti]